MIAKTLSFLLFVLVPWNVSLHMNELIFSFMSILLILLYGKNPFPMRSNYIYTILTFILIFTIYSFYVFGSNPLVTASFIVQGIADLYILTFIALYYSKEQKLLMESINNALVFFVVTWYVQFFTYYLTGHYIDYLQPITGEAQRYEAYFAAAGFNFIRPTGVFNEPGTYATVVLPLLVLSYLEKRKMSRLHYFILASYFFTLSLFAIMTATLFIIIAMLYKIKTSTHADRKKLIPLFIVVFITLTSVVQIYNSFRFNSHENLSQVRIRTNIVNTFANSNESTLLFGNGYDINWQSAVATDTSAWFRTVYDYGGILVLPLYALVVYISWGLPLFFVFIIFLTKINYVTYIFWLFFGSLMVIHKNRDYSALPE